SSPHYDELLSVRYCVQFTSETNGYICVLSVSGRYLTVQIKVLSLSTTLTGNGLRSGPIRRTEQSSAKKTTTRTPYYWRREERREEKRREEKKTAQEKRR